MPKRSASRDYRSLAKIISTAEKAGLGKEARELVRTYTWAEREARTVEVHSPGFRAALKFAAQPQDLGPSVYADFPEDPAYVASLKVQYDMRRIEFEHNFAFKTRQSMGDARHWTSTMEELVGGTGFSRG